MDERVVVVDDDAIILKHANMILTEAGFKVTCLKNGKLLLDYIVMNPIDILLLDIRMPDMDGFETMCALREWESNNSREPVPVIFLTANEDSDSEAKGLSLGAMDFIRKPFSSEALKIRVRNLIDLIKLQRDLHKEVAKKTAELESLSLHVVHTLAKTIDAKDAYTNGHSERVADYSKEIARRFGYSEDRQEEIYMMGLLHDVGKIGVPDTVINKPGRLTDEEYELMKTHTTAGSRIIANAMSLVSDSGYLQEAKNLATYHHERWDGKGYPEKKAGEEIPLSARIMAVADVFDALVSRRSYKEPFSFEKSMDIIREGAGTQFDPQIAMVFAESADEVRNISLLHESRETFE
jgi:putative two-component system response regulator